MSESASSHAQLAKLAEPFPIEDIEWRVAHSGVGANGVWCKVLAYITARAIQNRLDEVVGPENWRNEEPRVVTIDGKSAFVVGLSIKIPRNEIEGITSLEGWTSTDWVTKWDVCEPTNIHPAKGGFSGGTKRAGAQWGIGRYLYYLDETFATVSDKKERADGNRQWHHATAGKSGQQFWWLDPELPGWALPKEEETAITVKELNALKRKWKAKFSPEGNQNAVRKAFSQFVTAVCGEFPHGDHKCWSRESLTACQLRIDQTKDPKGVDGDVPFE